MRLRDLFGFVKETPRNFKLDLALVMRHRMVEQRDAVRHTSLRALATRKCGCAPPTRICIPACSAAPPPIRSGCWPRSWRRLHDDNGRVTIPASMTGVAELPPTSRPISPGSPHGGTVLGQVGLKYPAAKRPPGDRADHHAPDREFNGIVGGDTGRAPRP